MQVVKVINIDRHSLHRIIEEKKLTAYTIDELKYKIKDIEFNTQDMLQKSFKLLDVLFKDVNVSIDLSVSVEYLQLKLRVEELEDKLKLQGPDNNSIKARLTELLAEDKMLNEQVAELEKRCEIVADKEDSMRGILEK